MKHSNLLKGIFLLTMVSITFFACRKDKDSKPKPRTETYIISAYDGSGISGNALFKEILNTDSMEVTVNIKGNDINPNTKFSIAIRQGTALQDGSEKYSLGEVTGNSNHQATLTKAVKLSFDNLLELDGGLSVINSSDKLVAETEIGINKTFKSFKMKDAANTENGEFRVYKRDSGSYLVIKINDIENIPSDYQGVDHPAKIYKLEDGIYKSKIELNPVSDDSGVSATFLPDEDYNDLIKYDGSVKVLGSDAASDIIISQGNFK